MCSSAGCPPTVAATSAISSVLDEMALHAFESYAAAREQVIADQAESLLELSTPVVKLWDGIVAVPLIGTLDSARTQVTDERGRSGVRVMFRDEGPGIADVDLALTDGWTSGSGLGLGLAGTRRLVDAFDLETAVGVGTTITVTEWRR